MLIIDYYKRKENKVPVIGPHNHSIIPTTTYIRAKTF